MFEVNGWSKYGEQDHYEDGCDPHKYVSFSGNERWSADDLGVLLSKLRDFVGVDEDYEILLDSCDEDGRVDIQVLETNDSYPANEACIELWKQGGVDLWCSTYTFYVEKVERKSVRLVEAHDDPNPEP